MIFLRNYFIDTTNSVDVISIIHEVGRTIRESNIKDGFVNILVPAPGGGLAILEPLPDIVSKFKEALQIFPVAGADTKNRRKEEISIAPRVVSAIVGKTMQVPFAVQKLLLGPREEIILFDMELTAKRREFYVQVVGDGKEAAKPAR